MLSPENALTYGVFIQTTIDFLIVAFSIFLFVQLIAKAKERADRKKKAEAEVAPAPPPKTAEVLLLEEIRDLLKK